MNEVYEMLKGKIKEMQDNCLTEIMFDFDEIAQMYQVVCFMKQIKSIVDGCE